MGSNSSKNKGNVPNDGLIPKYEFTKDDLNKIQRKQTQKKENRTIPFGVPQKIDTKQQTGNVNLIYDCLIFPEEFSIIN